MKSRSRSMKVFLLLTLPLTVIFHYHHNALNMLKELLELLKCCNIIFTVLTVKNPVLSSAEIPRY